jgi:hypothetical protein
MVVTRSQTSAAISAALKQGCQTSWFDQESPDFQNFLLVKILLNSAADFEDFLLISPDSQYFGRFNFSDILNQ